METEKQKIVIRVAAPGDAEALLKIYAPYVVNTAITFEYTVPTVADFQARIRKTLEKYPYLVAESGGEILGYCYAGAFKERRAYDWAAEVSVYVAMDRRGVGIGRALYQALETALRRQNITNLNACIAYAEPEDCYLTQGSVRFHERCGYRLAGHFHQCGYKFNRWYDMVWMEKMIGEHRAEQPPLQPFAALEK